MWECPVDPLCAGRCGQRQETRSGRGTLRWLPPLCVHPAHVYYPLFASFRRISKWARHTHPYNYRSQNYIIAEAQNYIITEVQNHTEAQTDIITEAQNYIIKEAPNYTEAQTYIITDAQNYTTEAENYTEAQNYKQKIIQKHKII